MHILYILGVDTNNPEKIYVNKLTKKYLLKRIQIMKDDIEYFKSINNKIIFYADRSSLNETIKINDSSLNNFDKIYDIIDEYEKKIRDAKEIIEKIGNNEIGREDDYFDY
jgi:hypothetical protein